VTDLSGRVAWVTGGGRGIGRAISLAYGRAGAAVAISARTQAEVDGVAAEVTAAGGRALPLVADVMSYADLRATAARIAGTLGTVHVLVNNAGGGARPRRDPGLDADAIDDFAFVDTVALNLVSAYRASRAVLPGMLAAGYGRIINIGSGYAKRSGGAPAYTAAKHGIIGLTRAMAAQVARRGVTVNCLCPGWTNTRMVDLEAMAARQRVDVAVVRERIESENLQHRILEPEELAPMALLLAGDAGGSITGQVISVDGGYGV
jgi:NAD(P)-dependent dehydrogenase (short-subunit alcohol dehydrogenase family)